MNKRAIFFSLDALIALSIVFVLLLTLYPVLHTEHKTSSLPYDLIGTLSSIKVSEVDDAYVRSLITTGVINDTNKTLLEQIGLFYVNDIPRAKEFTKEILSKLPTSHNIGIWFVKKEGETFKDIQVGVPWFRLRDENGSLRSFVPLYWGRTKFIREGESTVTYKTDQWDVFFPLLFHAKHPTAP